jgi:hypothetical protein
MKNESEQQTEVQRAQDAGLRLLFKIVQGRICSLSYPERIYAACQVVIGIYPCSVNRHNVFHIHTPDGTKGIAIVEW